MAGRSDENMKIRLLIFLCLLWPTAALADIAPSNYDGFSIVPAENTEISMREETVNIFVRNAGEDIPFRYLCDVKAYVIMENASSRRIEIMVGFPVEPYSGKLDLFARSLMVKDDIYRFKVVANGVPVDSVSASIVNGSFMSARPDDYLWFGWRQAFDPETTRIQVEYSIVTTPVRGFNATRIGYSLYSGSFWRGPIGKAKIVVHFPRVMDGEYISGLKPEGYAIGGKEVIWSFEDFEPGTNDNLRLEFVPFELIDEIETARLAFGAGHDYSSAKKALAEAYLNTVRTYDKSQIRRLGTWDDTTYMKEAERLILEILDQNPGDCYVWNLYLSHFFKMHPGSWGPSVFRPGDRLSIVQEDLIEQACVHCPADTGIALWKALLDRAGPDYRDAVQSIEEAGHFITVWVKEPRNGGLVGWQIKPHEREILYMMYQPVDTVRSETSVMSGVKAEKREISLQPFEEHVPDNIKESVMEIVRWGWHLTSCNGFRIREYNEAAGIYR